MTNSSPMFRYWGKADPNFTGEPKWHPLVHHSLDVSACGKVLLETRPVWLETLSRLSNIPTGAMVPWVIFLLSIHDLGKFADGFQSRTDWMKKLQGRTANVPYDARHDTLGYELAMTRLPEWIARADLGQRGGGTDTRSVAAASVPHARGDEPQRLFVRL